LKRRQGLLVQKCIAFQKYIFGEEEKKMENNRYGEMVDAQA
jgi:hypothetical protein